MKALIIVDVQNDFVPGGLLSVPDGDQVVPVINRLESKFDLVVATQDWHPPDHGSFAESHEGREPGDLVELDGLQQILWPTHCVQNTAGAELVATLSTARVARIFLKGTDPKVDSYSGFFDNAQRRATGLHDYLASKEVSAVCIAGLATDYCVKYTALDACRLGYATSLVADACRGVELKPGDVAAAIEEMTEAGVTVIGSDLVGRKSDT